MATLKEMFEVSKNTPSDINEHLETLHAYAKLSPVIVELGTRWGNGTLGFLQAAPKELHCYDLEKYARINEIEQRVKEELPNTLMTFTQDNILYADVPECDLLFVDSYHVYQQVLLELVLHAKKARKFIIFHDTVSFADVGQSANHPGIYKAIEGFLMYNPEWVMIDQYANNNGLTVLAKMKGKRFLVF